MKAWNEFLELQEQELGLETVQKWLKPLKISRFDACNLYLEAKDTFQILWFEEHIRPKIKNLFNNNHKRIRVHLSTPTPSGESGKTSKYKTKTAKELLTNPSFALSFDFLDPFLTFENFVSTEAHLLAYKLLAKTAGYESAPEPVSFNPIYLHGCSGTGKTHLLMATAQALRARGLKVIYVRAETFTEHVVTAIRAAEMSMFRNAYRNIDVLIVDDVHVFSRKSATQEELFHTFNTLHLGGKQIILSANCSPSELQLIEPRLVSRFEWGIVLSCGVLKKEEMSTVLDKKLAAHQFPLSPKIGDFLLETFSSGPKSLSRALQALMLRAHLNEGGASSAALNIPKVKHLLSDFIQEEEKLVLTPSKIVQHVADHFGILTEELLGKSQTRDCVLPRQLAMFFCRQNLRMPFIKIGELFSRDHSTVMSSVKVIQKALDNSERDIIDSHNALSKKIHSSSSLE